MCVAEVVLVFLFFVFFLSLVLQMDGFIVLRLVFDISEFKTVVSSFLPLRLLQIPSDVHIPLDFSSGIDISLGA